MQIKIEPLLIMTMIQNLTSEMHEGVLTKVLTVTYNNGAQSKRILDAKTGMPLDIVWLRPLPKAIKPEVIATQNCKVGRVGLTIESLAYHYSR